VGAGVAAEHEHRRPTPRCRRRRRLASHPRPRCAAVPQPRTPQRRPATAAPLHRSGCRHESDRRPHEPAIRFIGRIPRERPTRRHATRGRGATRAALALVRGGRLPARPREPEYARAGTSSAHAADPRGAGDASGACARHDGTSARSVPVRSSEERRVGDVRAAPRGAAARRGGRQPVRSGDGDEGARPRRPARVHPARRRPAGERGPCRGARSRRAPSLRRRPVPYSGGSRTGVVRAHIPPRGAADRQEAILDEDPVAAAVAEIESAVSSRER